MLRLGGDLQGKGDLRSDDAREALDDLADNLLGVTPWARGIQLY
jgi:hypothetical protein